MTNEAEIRQMFETPAAQKQMPQVLKETLHKRLEGKLAQAELEVACCEFSIEKCLSEYSHYEDKPYPPEGYTRYMDYVKTLKEKGEVMNQRESLRAIEKFGSYWNECSERTSRNVTKAEWLLFCREILKDVEPTLAQKASDALTMYSEKGLRVGFEIVGMFLKGKEFRYGKFWNN